jgi:hypothetical protein
MKYCGSLRNEKDGRQAALHMQLAGFRARLVMQHIVRLR